MLVPQRRPEDRVDALLAAGRHAAAVPSSSASCRGAAARAALGDSAVEPTGRPPVTHSATPASAADRGGAGSIPYGAA